jgi:GNAT superfamily N-acetyltransferase
LRTERIIEEDPEVIAYLERIDPIRYSADIHNLKWERDYLDFYVCKGEHGEIKSHVSMFKASEATYVSIYGDDEPSIKPLVGMIPKSHAIVEASPQTAEFIGKWIAPTASSKDSWMIVKRGEEKLVSPDAAKRLSVENAETCAQFPSWPISAEWARVRLARDHVFGIFDEGKLVSVASVIARTPQTALLAGVETLEPYRGKGYATMAVSAATRDALKESETASLFVRSDNGPAIKIYEKLGYRKIGEGVWLDLGTGLLL